MIYVAQWDSELPSFCDKTKEFSIGKTVSYDEGWWIKQTDLFPKEFHPSQSHLHITTFIIIQAQVWKTYLFEKHRVSTCGGEGKETERGTFSSDSPPSPEPNAGLRRAILRSRLEPKSRIGCSANWATQVPQKLNIFEVTFYIQFCARWHFFPSLYTNTNKTKQTHMNLAWQIIRF